ncbi:MAG: DUF1659 domain-containing protein [Firmicutes bacterium]|nr:DUF1659 domain-containing protein [Bacillota bacterium]
MPVQRFALESRLQVRYQVGEDEHGDPVYRLRALARVNPESEDADLMTAVDAITGLQVFPVSEVRRVDNYELIASE